MSSKVCFAALVAALSLSIAAPRALALPVMFADTNVNSSTQSRINIAATASLSGTPLTEAPQFAPGGLNGDGSASALYNQTGTNTPSNMGTNLGLYSIGFSGNSNSQAANAVGLLNNNLAIAPGVGGTTGTAPADYGLIFSSAQSVVIPPIDISSLNLGVSTLNLGTLTSINLNVALRNFAINLSSPVLPTTGNGTYPQHFDSTKVTVSVSGTSDMSLTATLTQGNFTDWLATGAALSTLSTALQADGVSINVTSAANPLKNIWAYQVGIGITAPLPATNALNGDASQGTIDHVGSNLRLSLPVKFDIVPSTLPAPLNTLLAADFTMTGQLIGQTPFQTVPEPSSIALAVMSLVGLVGFARRRQ